MFNAEIYRTPCVIRVFCLCLFTGANKWFLPNNTFVIRARELFHSLACQYRGNSASALSTESWMDRDTTSISVYAVPYRSPMQF